MKKRNRTVPFGICEIKSLSILLITFLFLLVVTFYGFPNCCNSESLRKCQSNELLVKNTGLKVEIDEQEIDSVLKAEVKYIEFSDSKQYDNERNIVYRITNMAESEKYSEGSMKKATIRIALEDLNIDGIKEILAYIIQFEYCGKGGGYCTFLILQKDAAGNWRKLLDTSAYEGDIGTLDTQRKGYGDVAIRLTRPSDRKGMSIYRWNGRMYQLAMKKEVVFDLISKKEKIILWRWNDKSSSWVLIKEIKQ